MEEEELEMLRRHQVIYTFKIFIYAYFYKYINNNNNICMYYKLIINKRLNLKKEEMLN